jgi:hypothetical protein
MRAALIGFVLVALGCWASVSVAYGVRTALDSSADLERRAEEVELFHHRQDPYQDPDMTYPPTALPIFTALVPLESTRLRRLLWVGLNLTALAVFCGLVVGKWGRDWPWWVRLAFVLIAVGSKPARAGIALGQFHLIPTTLIVAAEVWSSRSALAGLLTGVALVKPTMALPYLAVMLAQGRRRSLVIGLALQGLLLIGVCCWLGIVPGRLIQEWLKNARSQSSSGTIDLPSLLGRAFPNLVGSAQLVTALVLAATCVLVGFLRSRSRLGLLAISTFSAALMTYHRHYDLVLLLPTLAYLINTAVRTRKTATIVPAVLFALLLVLPSDGRIVGKTIEELYDVLFVVASYVVLMVLVVQVWRESPEA